MRQHQTYIIIGYIWRTEILDGSGTVGSADLADDSQDGLLVLGQDEVVERHFARGNVAEEMAVDGANCKPPLMSNQVWFHTLAIKLIADFPCLGLWHLGE